MIGQDLRGRLHQQVVEGQPDLGLGKRAIDAFAIDEQGGRSLDFEPLGFGHRGLDLGPILLGQAGVEEGGVDLAQRALLASAPLFGARAYGAVSDNIQPIGILAQPSGSGSAIISVDGQPARAFQIGDDVGGRTLFALRDREIELEYHGQHTTYRLPEPRAAMAPGLGIAPVPVQ